MLSAGSLCAESGTRFVFHIRIYHPSDRMRIKEGEAKCFRQGRERAKAFAFREEKREGKRILRTLYILVWQTDSERPRENS